MIRQESFHPTKAFDHFLTQYRYSRVFKQLKKHKTMQVIYDMGCGQGGLVHALNQQGYEAYGVDLQGADKVFAANLNHPLPFQDHCADLITSLANLEHLDAPDMNLMEMHRMLKPGGVLLLTTPSPYAKPVLEFLAYRLKLIDRREIDDHKQYFSKKKLEHSIKEAGFSSVKVNYFQGPFNLQAIAVK